MIALSVNTLLRADKWVGRRAGGRVIGPGRPDDRGDGHVHVPCVHTHGGRAGWVARCTDKQATCAHSNQIGHSLGQIFPTETPHPAPLTPHPVPGILCFTHAPRTPHPTPSTLYHIGLRRPRTPDTQRRGSVAKALQRRGARHGNFQAPPPFFSPPHRISVPACVLYYKNKNRCFPTQFSPPHRNMLYALLVHGPQETQFLGLSQVFQVFFKMYQATHFQDPPI